MITNQQVGRIFKRPYMLFFDSHKVKIRRIPDCENEVLQKPNETPVLDLSPTQFDRSYEDKGQVSTDE